MPGHRLVKYTARILLLVMLTLAGICLHTDARAGEPTAVAAAPAAAADTEHRQHCPCAPAGDHRDHDGCDACCHCACHATLTVQPYRLGYQPTVLGLSTYERFRALPEVYLSPFVPPQNRA